MIGISKIHGHPESRKLLQQAKINYVMEMSMLDLKESPKFCNYRGAALTQSDYNVMHLLEASIGRRIPHLYDECEADIALSHEEYQEMRERDYHINASQIPWDEWNEGLPWQHPLCERNFAFTTRDGRIAGLALAHGHLEAVPAPVFQLDALEKLYLDGNMIASIPPSICNIRSLRVISISDNPIKVLPEELPAMGALEEINLAGTNAFLETTNGFALPKLRRVIMTEQQVGDSHFEKELRARGIEITRVHLDTTWNLPRRSSMKLSDLFKNDSGTTSRKQTVAEITNVGAASNCAFYNYRGAALLESDFNAMLSLEAAINRRVPQLYDQCEALMALPREVYEVMWEKAAVNYENYYAGGGEIPLDEWWEDFLWQHETGEEDFGFLTLGGRVRVFALTHARLGEVPLPVLQLDALTALYLDGNKITGLPANINQLNNLQLLSISENPLTVLPDALAELKSLGRINLIGTSLQDVPRVLLTLPNLEQISLDITLPTGDPVEGELNARGVKITRKFSDRGGTLEQVHEAIVDYVKTHPGCEEGDLYTDMEVHHDMGEKILRELLERGVLIKDARRHLHFKGE